MPLRDHFRSPIWNLSSWEGFHGGWPMTIVQGLASVLPVDYVAEPRVHLGTYYEIDVCAFEDPERRGCESKSSGGSGGVATMTWAPPEPTLVLEKDLDEPYEYEVRVFDQSRGRILVAAIEIVSPANKDRAASRRAFATKCAALIEQGVCVSIVDLVTVRDFNLYADVLTTLGQSDPALGESPPAVYAATCHTRAVGRRSRLETWAYPLAIGQKLPTLPIWLSDHEGVSLDLETSYEETCRALRIA
jgi:hypothetical protein